jgi:hypothetical protein
MKRLLFTILLLTAFVGGAVWVYFLPHLAIRHITNAIERGDTVALSRDIDFPILRANLKEQIRFLRVTAEMKARKSLAGFESFQDRLIDAFVTPYGFSQLRQKSQLPVGKQAETVDYFGLPNASYTYDSPSRFVATLDLPLDQKEHGELKLVLTRSGLRWRLDNVLFTDAMLNALSGVMASPMTSPSGSP